MVGWHHRLDGCEFEQHLEMMKNREAQHAAVHGVAKSWTQQQRPLEVLVEELEESSVWVVELARIKTEVELKRMIVKQV